MKSPAELRAELFVEYGASGGRFDCMPTDEQLKEYGLRCYRKALEHAKERAADYTRMPGGFYLAIQGELNDLDAIAAKAQEGGE